MPSLPSIPIREPAVLVRDPLGTPAYFWPQKEFSIKPVAEFFPVPAAHQATPEERLKSLYYQIDTQFVGEFEYLPYLFPNLSASLGASLLGTTDVPWRLITQSGRQFDFPRGGFLTRPVITSVPGQTLFGPSTFVAVCASDKQPGEAGAFFTEGTGGTFPSFTSFDPTKILTLAPKISYGALLEDAECESGIEITLAYGQPMEFRQNQLIRDWTITSQELTAKCKPYGLTFSAINTASGLNLAMGATLPTETLIVSFTGFYLELRGCTVKEGQFKIGPASDFIEGLVFRASQAYSAGAALAPGFIDVEPPEE